MERALVFVLSVLIAVALLASAPVAHAADQVVSDCGDNGGANQLRAKLAAAQSSGGGTITFTCGPTPIVLQNGVLPTITTNTTINGGGNIEISGNNATRIFYVNAGATLTLNNITLRNAFWDAGDGGAVRSYGTLNVNSSKFLYNKTSADWSGSAIYSEGPLHITNSEFGYNSGGGGAVKPRSGNAVTTITGSTFHHNVSDGSAGDGFGGAMQLYDAPYVTISGSNFDSNTAGAGGGAIYLNASSVLTLTNSTLSSNSASGGGGIHSDGTLNLTNSTLSGNSTKYYGGGIFNRGTANLTNSTLSGNGADYGGGIFNGGTVNVTNSTLSGNSASQFGGIGNFGTVNLKNTLIAKGASGANCESPFGGSFNLSDDGSCGFGAGRDNVTNLNLGPLANNGGFTKTHLPGAGSAAIDNGTGSGCPATDQRGVIRPKGFGCDVGSVEVQAVGCTAKPAAFPPNPVSPANGSTVTVRRVSLKWNARNCAEFYRVQVRVGSSTGTVVDKSTVVKPAYKTKSLPNGIYYWQVKACNWFGCRASPWWSFSVSP